MGVLGLDPGLKRAPVPSAGEPDVSRVGLTDVGHVPLSHRYTSLTVGGSVSRAQVSFGRCPGFALALCYSIPLSVSCD